MTTGKTDLHDSREERLGVEQARQPHRLGHSQVGGPLNELCDALHQVDQPGTQWP